MVQKYSYWIIIIELKHKTLSWFLLQNNNIYNNCLLQLNITYIAEIV